MSKKSCFDYFNNLDAFRFPIELRMKERASTYTILGKINTCLLFVYILYSIINSHSFMKKFPKISNQNIKIQERPFLNFSKEDLSLAFGVTDESNLFYADPTIFNFEATQVYVNLSNGFDSNKILNLKLCEPTDFPKNTSYFEKLGLNKYLFSF